MRVVILGSGRGSNAKAILEAQRDGKLGTARVLHLFSDQADAPILDLGVDFGVPSRFVDASPFRTKLDGEGERRFVEAIRDCEPDIVVLAGFMRVLKKGFLTAFAGRIINLHPSLLPSFPGLDGIGQALRRGVKVTGCTVHYVNEEIDGGPIIDQRAVRIDESDTLRSLGEKIHRAEHELLPIVIARLSADHGHG